LGRGWISRRSLKRLAKRSSSSRLFEDAAVHIATPGENPAGANVLMEVGGPIVDIGSTIKFC
jgi:hypothetical protein